MNIKKIVAGAAIAMIGIAGVALMPAAASADTAVVPVPYGSGIMGNNLTLGDLFVLNNLFAGNSNGILTGNGTSLGDLFVLDQLFGNGGGVFGAGAIGGGNSLGSLFVLDNLFRGNSNGLLSNHGTSLGDLFILNQLF